MLSGINTDVEYQGKIYHVQTEDGGQDSPILVTHLFSGGAILCSQKTSYADRLKDGLTPDIVREMMKEQHQAMIKNLTAGQIEGLPSRPPAVDSEGSSPSPAPSRLTMPQGRRTLDEVIDEYLGSRPEPPAT